jgi:hypothetical protein
LHDVVIVFGTQFVFNRAHPVGDGGRHAIFLQVWSVDPLPGHVDRAFFDPSTGTVTCP